MKHFGDITKLNGRDLPIVDIITGGSPCQDLSVAGNRKGLAGERSGLFMEQIRIIKEMRDYDRELHPNEPIRPRYMVWENVCGAFSSNKGEDFRAVLEETAKVVDKDAVIPEPPKGKWTPSGCIVGDGWSIAWRVHDAQFWGVPQRRKRISLVADFGGASAPEILFERKSLSGNTSESGEKRQGITTDTQRDINKTEPMCVQRRFSSVNIFENGITPTLEAGAGESGNNMPMVCGVDNYNQAVTGDISKSLTNKATDSDHIPCVCYSQDAYDKYAESDTSATIKQSGGNYGGERVVGSLCARDYKGVGSQYVDEGKVVIQRNVD